jgi:MFS transporter, OFA family, oxalate/formate antiporter
MERGDYMTEPIKNRGWTVTFAGTGINLALGILYAWSIFSKAITKSIETKDGVFTWDKVQLSDPYAVCCLCFAFSMILAGKCQDKFGPRVTAFIGGILVAIGLLMCSQTSAYTTWVIGFGVLAGAGIGFGYSAATPPALKWFPPAKTGLVAGLVVGGFGLASVYIAPLSEALLKSYGIQTSMMVYGIAFLIVVCGLSTLLVNPPQGFVPEGANPQNVQAAKKPAARDANAAEMMSTLNFWTLWFVYFIGAGVGLMFISDIAGMAKKSLGAAAFLAVAITAVGNAGGRVIAGIISDKIGRSYTLFIMLLFQAVLMFFAIFIVGAEHANVVLLLLLATFIGFNYGTNLSLFPSLTKDLWGLKAFGINYGFMFTAWGVGGFVLSRISKMLQTSSGSYTWSFILAGVMLLIGAVLTSTLKTTPERLASTLNN